MVSIPQLRLYVPGASKAALIFCARLGVIVFLLHTIFCPSGGKLLSRIMLHQAAATGELYGKVANILSSSIIWVEFFPVRLLCPLGWLRSNSFMYLA